MLTEYEAGFTIMASSGIDKGELLTDVADRLEALLSVDGDAGSALIVERDVSASAGYAIISSDRPHPRAPEYSVRLEARLCTDEQGDVAAQVRTRFISADENDPADLTAGPPDALREVVGSYNCKIGAYEFRNEVFEVRDALTARQVMNFINNNSRKIPVLALTENAAGRTAIEPQTALDYLLGLALVVRFKGNTSAHIKEATGQACFNGAMRFYWPEGNTSKFYWPNDAISVTQFQKDCIENAELQDLNGDFEQIFSAARTEVISAQRDKLATLLSEKPASGMDAEVSRLNRLLASEREKHRQVLEQMNRANDKINQLEAEKAETAQTHKRTTDDLLEEISAAKSALNADAASDPEQDKKLRLETTRANRYKIQWDKAKGRVTELQQSNKELQARLERAEAEAAAAKIPAIIEERQDSALELTGKTDIDNITILNHAINIYRNPTRRFIIRSLKSFYGDDNDSLLLVIDRNIRDEEDRKRLREAIGNNRPHDGIDVGHFEHIVMNAISCFGDNTRLSRRMQDVRQVRNIAAHPGITGINESKAKDGIRKVARALKEMGNNDDSSLVERLLPLVH